MNNPRGWMNKMIEDKEVYRESARAMCGKFTQARCFANAVRIADLLLGTGDAGETVTPMRFAQVVALDRDGNRKAVRMRWGLVPSFAGSPADFKPHIHARAETADSKQTFRDSFAKRRGLIFVTSFNEGEEVTPSRTQQYVLTPEDNAPVAIAIMWDRWCKEGEPALLSFAMMTVAANPLIATITDRMPALVEPDDWAKWLGEESATIDELKAMLRPSAREFDMQRAGKPPPPVKADAQLDLF
jgi:putative SOS response-associated peptidase YedK